MQTDEDFLRKAAGTSHSPLGCIASDYAFVTWYRSGSTRSSREVADGAGALSLTDEGFRLACRLVATILFFKTCRGRIYK